MARALILIVFVTALAAQATTSLEPGLWTLRGTVTTNGVTEPQDTETCLHESELADLGEYFSPALEEVEAQCERVREPSSDPDQLVFTMHCKGATFTVDFATDVSIRDARTFEMQLAIDTDNAVGDDVATRGAWQATWKSACPDA